MVKSKGTRKETISSDAIIIGGGLAGIVTALDLLDAGKKVILIDRDTQDRFGGLAKLSFGGILMVDTPIQRWNGIKDSISLAISDWNSTAEFSSQDVLPKLWAEAYVHHSIRDIFHFLRKRSVNFFPVVHWVERGLFKPGNSVPRFHMVWGTGDGLVESLKKHLLSHRNRNRLRLLFETRASKLNKVGKSITGCVAESSSGTQYDLNAEHVIIASGGIAGNLNEVRKYWPKDMGKPPEVLLNGSHPYAIGDLHSASRRIGAQITHLDKMWNYAAGVHHPNPKMEAHGLSLVPPKSALWLNSKGERIGPIPLVTGFDTRFLVERICQEKEKYSWQVMNWKIALKELAVSGSEFNEAIRNKDFIKFLKTVFIGNKSFLNRITSECPDFILADSIPELAAKMNQMVGNRLVDSDLLEKTIRDYDTMIDRGEPFFDDDQLRRISQLRRYRGERPRTCKFQKIMDRKALPLLAIREFILTRKSMGGIQTDLKSRVLDESGNPIPGLYAVGEAAGFGGGGIHGKGTLEGTFLGGCILTARFAARSILEFGN
ncbi:FAD binding domain protein [Leptospira inadai serovar Lyme str. 10]|uniref:FAD binding domain protein n=2 Tax=Leptospira inadai serovar Lyme TaxID=293084 RepID=V6HBH3_9LEPT|nr:FAD-binding dehydrogenase [Leptospira inadai]EQA36777.1 FAD binding domain protein [Leptospira inadai serovar Lyme str. 10]PNV73630.1 FAD-binding dehydrogenase [Leptospira inadai serovar Lyme]